MKKPEKHVPLPIFYTLRQLRSLYREFALFQLSDDAQEFLSWLVKLEKKEKDRMDAIYSGRWKPGKGW